MADKDRAVTTIARGSDDELEHSAGRARTEFLSGTGEKQILDRYINQLGIVNFGFTLQAAWEFTGMSMGLIFLNGGAPTLVWGTLISMVGHTLVALSLGEMASMDPTIGAQYRWSARFARKWPEFWGLMQGWITTFAWIVTAAPTLMVQATCVQALIGFYNESYVPKAWETTLLMWAVLLVAIFFNFYLRRILNTLETLGGLCHILFFVACIIILTTLAERKPASYVFKDVISGVSGWNNPFACFNIGLLIPLLPLSGYDSVLHMIDETRKPRERVPRSMILAVTFNGVLQFAYAITLAFCIGDEEKVASSAQPVLEIYYQATKSKTAATIVLLMHQFVSLVGLFNIIASASRLTWAFARDKGLPFSGFFVHVSRRFQLPLQALGLVVAICVILSLVNLGSSAAFNSIIAIPTVVLFVSYFIPIFHLTVRKLAGQHPRYGPFRLGRWGLPINLASLLFCAYCAIWTAFPASLPVVAETFNYAGPVLIGLVLLCMLDWSMSGHKRFVVPTGIYNIVMEDENELTDRSGENTKVSSSENC